jgi:hypothetical protein
VKFLAEKVCFIGQENLCALNFPEIEALGFCLLRRSHNRITEGRNMVTEVLRIIDDLRKNSFFIRLEWEVGNLILPCLEILKLRSSRITWYLDPPVADGTGILLIILNLSASNLEALAMIPIDLSVMKSANDRENVPFMT